LFILSTYRRYCLSSVEFSLSSLWSSCVMGNKAWSFFLQLLMSISSVIGLRTNLRPPNPLYCINDSLSLTVACRFSFSNVKAIRRASIFCWRCCFLLKPIFLYPYCDYSNQFGVEQVKLITVCEIIG